MKVSFISGGGFSANNSWINNRVFKPVLKRENIRIHRTEDKKYFIYATVEGFERVEVPYSIIAEVARINGIVRPMKLPASLVIDYCINNGIYYHPIEEA